MTTSRARLGLAALCLAAAACAPSAAGDADLAAPSDTAAALPADPHAGLPGRPPPGPAPLDSAAAAAAFAVLPFDAARVPAALERRGEVVAGARWRDRWGENWMLLTRVGPAPDGGCEEGAAPGEAERCTAAELHAYGYVVRPDTAPHLLWKTADAQRGCPYELRADFVPGAVHATDLDHDGTGEGTFAYRLACRADAARPLRQKLVMHEGTAVYAVRGTARLPGGEEGERAAERGFDAAGPALKAFALRVWDENAREGG